MRCMSMRRVAWVWMSRVSMRWVVWIWDELSEYVMCCMSMRWFEWAWAWAWALSLFLNWEFSCKWIEYITSWDLCVFMFSTYWVMPGLTLCLPMFLAGLQDEGTQQGAGPSGIHGGDGFYPIWRVWDFTFVFWGVHVFHGCLYKFWDVCIWVVSWDRMFVNVQMGMWWCMKVLIGSWYCIMVLISPDYCICKQVVPSSLIGKVLCPCYKGGSVRLAGGQPDRSRAATKVVSERPIKEWTTYGELWRIMK